MVIGVVDHEVDVEGHIGRALACGDNRDAVGQVGRELAVDDIDMDVIGVAHRVEVACEMRGRQT